MLKSPYELDLEVKDRKPDIVPKTGDKVKIKSLAWYEKWKNEAGDVRFDNAFVRPMSEFCGMILTIKGGCGKHFLLEGCLWSWAPEFFEEVYPKQPQIDAVSCSASAIDDVSAATAVGYTYPSSPQGIGISADWNKIIKDASERITVPCNLPSHAYTQAELERVRSLWGLKKEPELQMIKKRRFIKLEKL